MDRLHDNSDSVAESARRRIIRALLPHDGFVPFREVIALLDAAGEVGVFKSAAEELCRAGLLERRARERHHELVAYRIAAEKKSDAEALLEDVRYREAPVFEPSHREKRRAARQERVRVAEWFDSLEWDDPLRPLFTAYYRGDLPFSDLRARLAHEGFPGQRWRRAR